MNRASIIALGTALGAVLAAACSEPTSTAPTQLNLDRPVDMAFACWGGMRVNPMEGNEQHPEGTTLLTAQPNISCELRSQGKRPPTQGEDDISGNGDEIPGTLWFGFILQSAPGTVAIAQWATVAATSFQAGSVQVLDADPLTPGKNSISVGEEPIAIATDRSGCFEVTANAGSCDLSALDINSALDGDADTPAQVKRLTVTNAAGETILARPAAMIAQPSTIVDGSDVGKLCKASPSGVVYIAYPSCHLVAAVELTTDSMGKPVGRMVAGIKYDGTGVRITDGSETCPAECVDTGMRAPITAGPRPTTLSLDQTSRRLAIGSDNRASFDVVDLGLDALPDPTVPVLSIALENRTGDLGITAIALSSKIGMGGDDGLNDTDPVPEGQSAPPGGFGQYVYGVATDGTVRVADVLELDRECDTQLDARFLRGPAEVPSNLPPPVGLVCPRIRDPMLPISASNLPRRANAKGPGIELIGDVVPLSVAFFTVPRVGDKPTGTTRDELPGRLIGHFAVITGSNGFSYVVNVDDDNARDAFAPSNPFGQSTALVLPHQLRDAGQNRGVRSTPGTGGDNANGEAPPECDDAGPTGAQGGPRATAAPTRNLFSGPIASNKADELPSLRKVTCVEPPGDPPPNPPTVPVSEVQFSADPSTRDVVFPDLRGLRADDQWTLTWEGPLLPFNAGLFLDGRVIRVGRARVDALGLHLLDPANPFCEAGVEPYDIAQLIGCNPSRGNFDCPTGYECFLHPESQIGIGACLASNEAERLANLCRDFLISGRRYTVNSDPRSGDLVLLPRKHQLHTTPIDGCVDDNQCTLLANYAAHARTDKDPVGSPVVQPVPDQNGQLRDVNGHMWSCRVDEARAEINSDPAQNKRCIQVCTTNDDCNVEDDELNRRFSVPQFKMVCQSGVCMEGITPPQQCVNGPQRYDLHASESFAVVGSASGYVHPITDTEGRCELDPNANILDRGRIPLDAPACDPMADPITGALPGGGFEPNPCSTTVTQSELQRTFTVEPTACTATTGGVVPRQNTPAIRFRNRGMTVTLVDPYYPGDDRCILDRAGQYGKMPLVYQGYQLAFRQSNGFSPLTLPIINPAFPIKVVRGPTESIWILDDGDFLSTSITTASTRGKVFRVESVNLNTISLLQ